MSKSNFNEDFKRDAVRQITERRIRFRRFRSVSASASIRSANGRRSLPRRTPKATARPMRSGGWEGKWLASLRCATS